MIEIKKDKLYLITGGSGFATAASVSGSFGTSAQVAGVAAGAATSASAAVAAAAGVFLLGSEEATD